MSGEASDALHDPATTDIRGRRDQLPAEEGPPVIEALETYKLTVNGREREVEGAWIGESLLYVLRERLGLPGAKNACEQGECGSCTVYLDGEPVCSCLVAAGQAQGRDVVTVEGLAPGGDLHPVQQAFVEAGAVQCGFCTPGLVVAAHDLLARTERPSDLEIREALAGNLCRCTGYEKILDAVRLAAERTAGPR